MNRTPVIILIVLAVVVALFVIWYMGNDADDQLSQQNNNSTTATSTESNTTRSSVVLEENNAGNVAEIRSATLSQSGFIVIFTTSTTTTDGSVQGVSSLLSPGTYSDVMIQLDSPVVTEETLVAVLFADSNGNGVFDMGQDPYLSNRDLIIISDVDVVGTSLQQEPAILDQQIEFFIENATTTEA